ncbi:MAG: S8 family serine peptidase, partial [bacterium]|nr:S8 family serine peptidase [bacterium]
MLKRQQSIVIRVIAILAIAMLILPVRATAEPVEDVLVTFYQQPGPAEITLVQSLGGIPKKIYTIVPTILASLPSENLEALEADPRVKRIEPDSTMSGGLLGEVLPWGVDRVDAELVHPTNKGTGVKVAILDSGIDLDHPDLAVSGIVTFVTGTTNGDDDNGHGTLVAGIVGA